MRRFFETSRQNRNHTGPREVTSCDALILPGGGDITPAFFGENKGSRTVDTELDILQFQALDTAIAARIPVIGICKGMQVINVAFGGTILQDMSGDSLHSIPSGDAFHDSIMTEDSRLFQVFSCRNARQQRPPSEDRPLRSAPEDHSALP